MCKNILFNIISTLITFILTTIQHKIYEICMIIFKLYSIFNNKFYQIFK